MGRAKVNVTAIQDINEHPRIDIAPGNPQPDRAFQVFEVTGLQAHQANEG